MTVLDVSTATGPTGRSVWRRNRAALLLAAVLLVALTALAVLTGSGRTGELDPDAYDPSGAHALSQLLQDQGSEVVRTTDLPQTQAAATPSATTFVPFPQLLSDEEIAELRDLPGSLVVAGAGDRTLGALDVDVSLADTHDDAALGAQCDLPFARNAGRAEVGGNAYDPGVSAVDPVGCYPVDRHPTLLSLPAQHLVLIGSADALTNARLGKEGNAALGLGLLSAGSKVVWLMPALDRVAVGTKPAGSPGDLLPDRVYAVADQVFLAVLVLALYRGRRLGRVVNEPLPVVVRASETVEGRGRLYRAARARDTAADALRAGARDQLSRRLHGGAAPDRETLVTLVAERSSLSAPETDALLYGRAPSDDDGLVRLADALDTLIREVASS